MKRLALLFVIAANSMFAQDVLKLGVGETSPNATIKDVDWLAGFWVGTGLGGDCEELWLPPSGGSMQGVFRYAIAGQPIFTEYMNIVETNGSLSVKLKHYNADLSPWEEKDKWVEFRLVKLEGQTAWFNGLTYLRVGDDLLIKLILKSQDKERVEEFKLSKKVL